MDSALGRGALVLLAAVGLLATSCGVAAEDLAATYRGEEITTSVVDALAADEAFAELLGFPLATSEGVIAGTTARSVLDFLLQGAALSDLAEREGLRVEPDEALLASTLEGFQAQGYRFGVDDLSPEAREVLSRFVVADQALTQASVELPEPSEDDLRYVYEQTAQSGRWERTCVTMVAAESGDAGAVESALEEGTELGAMAEEVEGTQVVLDAEQSCSTQEDLANLPPDLAAAVREASTGELVGPVEVSQSEQVTLAVWFEVRSVETLDLEAARDELAAEVAQSLVAVDIARETEVNPRYGDGVGLEPTSSQQGQPVLVARVQRPPAPEGGPVPAQPTGP